MDRDNLIGIYFELGISYRDILKSLAVLHGIILSERHLQRFMRMQTGCRMNYFDLLKTREQIILSTQFTQTEGTNY